MAAKRRSGGGATSFLTFIVGLMLLTAAAVLVGGWFAWREASRAGPLKADAVVLFEPGASVASMAEQLADVGALRYPELFIAVVRLKGQSGALKAGEFRIPAGSSVLEIIDLIIEGKSILHYLTAPEGRTTKQILRLIAENETLVGELTLSPAEGELLPETYAFTRGRTRDDLVKEMLDAQDKVLAEIWEGRAMDLPFTTQEEAIILASIVEKETGVPEERPLIAAVFANRLKKKMRLQSDPTIIYGLTGGEPLGRGLRVSEIEKRTPYNTYLIDGLPPTPIANPGRAAIEAVLNPAESDALYFVADGTGGHVFAATLEEHNRNVAEWRRVERAQREEG
ncbi:MAG: endolytic transglycosylase MltG [Parvularculaceae bacterium]|nr:endolytic transglycosylase MltG [Parvularculaceae bacterium]